MKKKKNLNTRKEKEPEVVRSRNYNNECKNRRAMTQYHAEVLKKEENDAIGFTDINQQKKRMSE